MPLLIQTRPSLGNAGTCLQLEPGAGVDLKHGHSKLHFLKEGLLLSGGPRNPTTSLLPLKTKTRLACEPEGEEETQASSLVTSIPWVSFRDRRGSGSQNSEAWQY